MSARIVGENYFFSAPLGRVSSVDGPIFVIATDGFPGDGGRDRPLQPGRRIPCSNRPVVGKN